MSGWHELLQVLPIVASVLTGVLAVLSSYQAVRALRAQKRARRLISERMSADSHWRELIDRIQRNALDGADFDKLRSEIEELLERQLSVEDRRFVLRGLHQSNRISERRFMLRLAA
jgi:hypothetical protein